MNINEKYCTLCINNMAPKGTLGLCFILTLPKLMTHTTNVYVAAAAAAYLGIMLLSLLAHCRG